MNRRTTSTLAVASVVAATLTGAVPTFASNQSDAQEFTALKNTTVSLSEAIGTAEKEFGGKAVNATIDIEQAAPAYEIELMSDNGSQTISVDATTGKATVFNADQEKDQEEEAD